MLILELLQRELAETHLVLAMNESLLEEAMLEFKKAHAKQIEKIAEQKTEVVRLREEISRIILERFNEDGTRPEYPLSLQVRSMPKIFDEESVIRWAFVNEEHYLFKLDEKAVKEYLKENRVICDEVGEVLASMVDEPIPQIGEKTLLSWLSETQFNEENNAEENPEAEI